MLRKSSNLKGSESTLNVDFVQVYHAGWERIQQLINDKPRSTLRVYIYLLSHMTKNGVVFATQTKMAADLDMSLSTVKRNIMYLQKNVRSIVVLKSPSAVNMYGINPREAWRSTESQKSNSLYERKRESDQFPKSKTKPVKANDKNLVDRFEKKAASPKDLKRSIDDRDYNPSQSEKAYNIIVDGDPF